MSVKRKQREHYDRLFREYESKSRRSAYMRLVRKHAFDRWSQRLAGKRVLDLGCGHGETTARLVAHEYSSSEGCTVTGLDLSYQFVRRAREVAGGLGRADWVQGDAEKLPFGEEMFVAVVSLGTLHHLPQPGAAIDQVARVLEPGGWLLAVEPNALAFQSTLDFYGNLIPACLHGWLERWRTSRLDNRSVAENQEFHVGVRAPAQYADLAARAGMCARVETLILPLFPFTLFGLHRWVLTWRIAACVSRLSMVLFPSLRDRGLVLILEAAKADTDRCRYKASG